MQEDGKKDYPSQPIRNDKTGSDGDAVKKSMDDQSHEHRVSPVAVDECILVSFLAKVEVRRDRMFEQVNQKISGQNEDGGALAASSRLAGNISTIAVASMNPAPSATKYFR